MTVPTSFPHTLFSAWLQFAATVGLLTAPAAIAQPAKPHVDPAKCLPTLELPDEFTLCDSATDCVVYNDSCRSCQPKLIVINAKFLERVRALDYSLRRQATCLVSCEGCATAHIPLRCDGGRCQIASRDDSQAQSSLNR
jgi:hypothetical protein